MSSMKITGGLVGGVDSDSNRNTNFNVKKHFQNKTNPPDLNKETELEDFSSAGVVAGVFEVTNFGKEVKPPQIPSLKNLINQVSSGG